MATVTRLPLHRLSNEELAIQSWELVMAGQRSSHEFMCINAEIRQRSQQRGELQLAQAVASAPESRSQTPAARFFAAHRPELD